jgi:hypothetical protein
MKTLLNLLVTSVFFLLGACQSGTIINENPINTNPNPVVLLQTSIPADSIPQTPVPGSDNGNEGVPMPSFSTIDINVTVVPVEITSPPPTQPIPDTQSFGPIFDAIISLVKDDLAQKTGVSLDKIKVLEADAVEWPDGSLGCGKPGTEYVQVVTPGFRISLEADSKVFSYHTNTSKQIILCSEQLPHGIIPTP